MYPLFCLELSIPIPKATGSLSRRRQSLSLT